jgi:uracil-DNA glycosylase
MQRPDPEIDPGWRAMPADRWLSVEELIPEHPTLERLRETAAGCQGCGLWRDATQTVFGEGTSRAEVILVGEQPGDVGGPDRQTVHGTSRQAARPGAGGGRHRPPRGLRPLTLATVHPSSVLRAPDDEARAVAYRGLVEDLSQVAKALSG